MTADRAALSWDALIAFPGGIAVTYLGSLAGLYALSSTWAAVVWFAWILLVLGVSTALDLRRPRDRTSFARPRPCETYVDDQASGEIGTDERRLPS